MMFTRMWFDAERCRAGIDALAAYRREWNDRIKEFKATPVHDWASHGADSARYLAVGLRERTQPAAQKARFMAPALGDGGWMGS